MSLRGDIIGLMSDGRERTINDVLARVKADPDAVKEELRTLTCAKTLRSKSLSGSCSIQIYRMAMQEAAQ